MTPFVTRKLATSAFAALNAIYIIVLIVRFAGVMPRLAHVLPVDASAGIDSPALWLILALGFLTNVVAALVIGFIVIFPALLDGVGIDERKVTRLLRDRAGISNDALDAALTVFRAEAQIARRRVVIGRAIILGSGFLLIFAFNAVCSTLAHASPGKPLYTQASQTVENASVTNDQVWRFTGDQIAGAIALDIPELYDLHFGTLDNNVHSRIFTDFVFAFRAILGWIAMTSIIVTIRDWRSNVRPEKVPSA